MTERALGPLPEIVVVQQPVLDDAERGARGAHGDGHLQHRARAAAARELRYHRHDQEEHQLLRVDEAGPRIGRRGRRDERPRRIRQQRPEEPRDLDPIVMQPHRYGPAEEREGEHDARGRDRQLERGDESEQACDPGQLHPIARRRSGRNGQRRHRLLASIRLEPGPTGCATARAPSGRSSRDWASPFSPASADEPV